MEEQTTITVGFRTTDIEGWLSSSHASAPLLQAGDLLVRWNLQLRPLHAGTRDAGLARWFTVEVPVGVAPDVLAALRAEAAVDAAFVKPPEEPPG